MESHSIVHTVVSGAVTRRGFMASCVFALLGGGALSETSASLSGRRTTSGPNTDMRVGVVVIQRNALGRKRLGADEVCRRLRVECPGMVFTSYDIAPGEEARLREIVHGRGAAEHDAYLVYLVNVLAGVLTEVVVSSGKPTVVAERCSSSGMPLRYLPRLKRAGTTVLPAGVGIGDITQVVKRLRVSPLQQVARDRPR